LLELFLLFISAALVNNFVLVQFLGLCPFMGVSTKIESAVGMSMATTFVLTLASVCSYLVDAYILQPLGIEFLQTISFILVIAAVVSLSKMFIEKTSPLLYRVLGIYIPLITTNCAVLGVALNNTYKFHNFFQSLIADVPAPFKGAAIAMITAGLMSLAFMGFNGMV